MSASVTTFKVYRSPQTVVGRFIFRQTFMSAGAWALAFGAIVASKASGYVSAAPTAADRAHLAGTFGSNAGLSALLGAPRHIDTVSGFTTWNTLGVMVIVGSIWAFLLATKTFRGAEVNGRWELLLSGQTTARRATANALAGLGLSLVVMYAIAAGTFGLAGKLHGVGYSVHAAMFFALAAICGAAIFMALGAFASQLMPTRSRAAGMCAVLFGASFLVRAMADSTSAHWLLNFTPLGWIEKLQPLYGSQPIWLLPLASLIAVLVILTIFLSGRRDLYASLVADRDSAKPHTRLLRSPLTMAFRLRRVPSLGWLAGAAWMTIFFGLLAKTAAQAFASSQAATHEISKLANTSQSLGATTFLGIAFFMFMLLVMACAASQVGAIREDEAEGFLDNLLVRPVSRLRWLGGRIVLAAGLVVTAGLVGSAGAWAGQSLQHTGIAYHVLLQAGVNAMAGPLFVLGLGVFAFGFVPRLTTVIAYGAIAWSFLLQIVASGINLNHWLLDTSILHHVALVPAASPNWKPVMILIGLGAILGLLGMARFNNRDLQAE